MSLTCNWCDTVTWRDSMLFNVHFCYIDTGSDILPFFATETTILKRQQCALKTATVCTQNGNSVHSKLPNVYILLYRLVSVWTLQHVSALTLMYHKKCASMCWGSRLKRTELFFLDSWPILSRNVGKELSLLAA